MIPVLQVLNVLLRGAAALLPVLAAAGCTTISASITVNNTHVASPATMLLMPAVDRPQ
jgi:hypothetical protein